MSASNLRIMICNDPAEPAAMTLTPDRLARALAQRPALAGRTVARFGGLQVGSGGSIDDADVLFTNGTVALDEAKRSAPSLRWVQSMSAGVEALLQRLPPGLTLTNASGVHAEKAGEFVLAAVLMLNHAIPQFMDDKSRRAWKPVFGPTLRSRRILVLGTGDIGRSAARALRPFGCRVTGVNRSGIASADFHATITAEALDAALPEADVLVSTLPATPLTKGLVDRRRVALLPEGAGVVSVGRASVLDYEVLYDRLDDGTLAGVIADVFPEEPPPPSSRAWTTPRLIITPHCSVDDHVHYLDNCLEIFLDNLENDLAGRPLQNIVDPATGY
jgi:phosphoglycerate dehydrogenase-like enzyme